VGAKPGERIPIGTVNGSRPREATQPDWCAKYPRLERSKFWNLKGVKKGPDASGRPVPCVKGSLSQKSGVTMLNQYHHRQERCTVRGEDILVFRRRKKTAKVVSVNCPTQAGRARRDLRGETALNTTAPGTRSILCDL